MCSSFYYYLINKTIREMDSRAYSVYNLHQEFKKDAFPKLALESGNWIRLRWSRVGRAWTLHTSTLWWISSLHMVSQTPEMIPEDTARSDTWAHSLRGLSILLHMASKLKENKKIMFTNSLMSFKLIFFSK